MLDLLDFFKTVSDTSYCVVKMSQNFPRHAQGEDIDIFCYSLDVFTRRVLSWGGGYVKNGWQIKVQSLHKKRQAHVDFYKDDALQFRFDLYAELPAYGKLRIKPALFESVIENGRRHPYGDAAVEVTVPAPVDDLLIRYLEFMEYYDVRPDKIKHLDIIMANSDEKTRAKLLEKLHHYTKLPPVFVPQGCPFCRFTARLKKHLPG